MKVLVCAPYTILTNYNDGVEEYEFFGPKNIKKIEETFDEVVWNYKKGKEFTKEHLKELVKGCDAAISGWGSIMYDKEVLDCAPNLKMIAHTAGTVASVVNEETYDKGIKVIGANDREFSESVAEGALAMALTRYKNIDGWLRHQADEKVPYEDLPPKSIFGCTFGIVSYGAVASHLARLLQPFGCKIMVYSKYSVSDEEMKKYNMQRASLEEVFKECDIISLHTAWNKHTENMISEDLIKSMKDGALLINTARGKIVYQTALEEELAKGRIQAALDVLWKEPPPPENPLWDMPNVFITDHRGGPTPDRYKYIASNIIDDVYNFLKDGTVPTNEIKKERALSMSLH
ncbi:MAG: hydroxyacid dehydrogenase [Clostridia bacterium]|nr:hydroxyacid dehydrogenase [Clostridia bacterium]